MRLSVLTYLAVLLLSAVPASTSFAQKVDLPEKRPEIKAPEKPAAEADDEGEDEDEDEDDDDDREDDAKAKAAGPATNPEGKEGEGEDEEELSEATNVDEGQDGMPPMPMRAPPLSQRGSKQASEPLGPEPPPQQWSETEIAEAKTQCEKLVNEAAFEYRALDPIRSGACGAPAPISLKFLNDVPRVELRPAAVITCPLAAALDRWLREVVQPRAKALLHANVIRMTNMSGYQCRTRYGNPTQRMSHHAFAEALDVGEFMTAKGERINVLEHWPADDARGRFLKEIHQGACKIFGTVLGPEANEAHKNHFHFDMAKRRHSSYCQ